MRMHAINPVGTMADGDTIYAQALQNEATVKLYMLISTSQEHLLPALCPAIKNAVMNSKISDEEFLSMVK